MLLLSFAAPTKRTWWEGGLPSAFHVLCCASTSTVRTTFDCSCRVRQTCSIARADIPALKATTDASATRICRARDDVCRTPPASIDVRTPRRSAGGSWRTETEPKLVQASDAVASRHARRPFLRHAKGCESRRRRMRLERSAAREGNIRHTGEESPANTGDGIERDQKQKQISKSIGTVAVQIRAELLHLLQYGTARRPAFRVPPFCTRIEAPNLRDVFLKKTAYGLQIFHRQV